MVRAMIVFTIVLASATPAWTQDRLPTLEEALQISQASGRPILAMAGQRT